MDYIECDAVRINKHLVKSGNHECNNCGHIKPCYRKAIATLADRVVKQVSCFCCNDTGSIPDNLVRKYFIADYSSSDCLVPCRRCDRGKEVIDLGWDIATKAECEAIHKQQRALMFAWSQSRALSDRRDPDSRSSPSTQLSAPEPAEVKAVVQTVIDGFSFPKSNDDSSPDPEENTLEHYEF